MVFTALWLCAASADVPSPVAAAFGNTVISTYADGRHQYIWLKADDSWSGIGRNGKPVSGRWSLNADGRICLRQQHPPTLPIAYCTRIPPSAQVGSSWDAKDIIGRSIVVKLVAGTAPPVADGSPAPAP